jgi:hypothetical protein
MAFDLEGVSLINPRYVSISSFETGSLGKKADVLLIYTSLNDIMI